MKAKVLKYASDGNNVVSPYMELTPLFKNTFTSPYDKDYFWLVVLVQHEGKEAYIVEGTHTMERLTSNKETIETFAESFLAEVPNRAWIGRIFFSLYEALGLPTDILTDTRANQEKARIQKETERKAESEARAKEWELKRIETAKQNHAKLKAGERVNWSDVVDSMNQLNFSCAHRTKGTMNKQQGFISLSNGNFLKKTSAATRYNLFAAVKEFAAFEPV